VRGHGPPRFQGPVQAWTPAHTGSSYRETSFGVAFLSDIYQIKSSDLDCHRKKDKSLQKYSFMSATSQYFLRTRTSNFTCQVNENT
jgi:hypothetical protein